MRWAEVWFLLVYCLWKFSVPSDTMTSAGTGVKDLGCSMLWGSQDCSPIRKWPAFSIFILGPGTGQKHTSQTLVEGIRKGQGRQREGKAPRENCPQSGSWLLARGRVLSLGHSCPDSCLKLLWPSLALDGGHLGTVEEVPSLSFQVLGLPGCELAKREFDFQTQLLTGDPTASARGRKAEESAH